MIKRKRRLPNEDEHTKKVFSDAEVLEVLARNDDSLQVLNLKIGVGQDEFRTLQHISKTIQALRGNTSVAHINLQLNGFSLDLINELTVSLIESSIRDIDILPCLENLSSYFFECLKERLIYTRESREEKATRIQSIYVAQLSELCHAKSFASFLGSCSEQVQDLALRNYSNDSLQVVIRALVERSSGVESISLPNLCGIDVVKIYAMLAKCSNLRSLELCVGGSDTISNILPTIDCCGRLHLKSLAIDMSYIDVSTRITFFNSLPQLCPDLSSLHLEFEGNSDADNVFWTDITVGQGLADLHHLTELSIESMYICSDIVTSCRLTLQSLNYLHLKTYGSHRFENFFSVIIALLKECQNLKHLTISITNEAEFYRFFQVIQEIMPNLKALTICDLDFLPGKQELELKLLQSLKCKSHLIHVDFPDIESKITLRIHREIEFDCMLRYLNDNGDLLFITSPTTLRLFPFLCEKLIRSSWIDVIYFILQQNQEILTAYRQ
jgi:hypothetical protein